VTGAAGEPLPSETGSSARTPAQRLSGSVPQHDREKSSPDSRHHAAVAGCVASRQLPALVTASPRRASKLAGLGSTGGWSCWGDPPRCSRHRLRWCPMHGPSSSCGSICRADPTLGPKRAATHQTEVYIFLYIYIYFFISVTEVYIFLSPPDSFLKRSPAADSPTHSLTSTEITQASALNLEVSEVTLGKYLQLQRWCACACAPNTDGIRFKWRFN